jgi:hypothetical protein
MSMGPDQWLIRQLSCCNGKLFREPGFVWTALTARFESHQVSSAASELQSSPSDLPRMWVHWFSDGTTFCAGHLCHVHGQARNIHDKAGCLNRNKEPPGSAPLSLALGRAWLYLNPFRKSAFLRRGTPPVCTYQKTT